MYFVTRTMLLAATTLAVIAIGPVARADEFAGQPSGDVASASLNQQATAAESSDPTAPNSLRSHGRP